MKRLRAINIRAQVILGAIVVLLLPLCCIDAPCIRETQSAITANGQTKTAGARQGRKKASARKSGIAEIRSLDPVKEAFQRDTGKIRLVTLLSPT